MNPLISVIIPTYNYGAYLKNCLVSVLNQSLADIEVLIINDGSTDDTESVVSSFSDNRIIYKKHTENLGVAQAVCTGQMLTRGKYICTLDSDDWLPEESLLLRYNALQKHNVDIVHTGLTRIENGTELYIRPIDTTRKQNIIQFLNDPQPKWGINSATFLYSRTLHSKAGFRDTSGGYDPHDDFEFALRLLTAGSSIALDANTYMYTIHAGSYSQNFTASMHSHTNFEKVREKYIKVFTGL